MIGWWFLVLAQTPVERERIVASVPRSPEEPAAILASWEINPAGIDWIDELVAAGKATEVHSGWYPSRYRALASDVLPRIEEGPPEADMGFPVIGDDYVMAKDWRGNVTLHRERMARTPPSQALTIEVWDRS